ncbi:hypothetical protein M409DRAFT_22895 [Zasmidium cellare ATCC 36951]|uniref:Uncharacterized protein n=1 Tax=Zasmidium cellare ATCC 36951 TaxID=1080233 RepID=A0A6A6CL02_ZASCE|nr:uncharacterized protein M409DRAFT_22895 [Zasmidium cellare ATCC 36951]KAF2166840.1 hypothetical protein M409DRAFT_22895 [Zasmidium cellare ATCC 36951]
MGDRQQFVVAAKVNGKYRMVASVHHQSIYGRTSLRQCLSILKILSAACNLPNIRRELADAASSVKPSISLDAYPFISTALIVGSSYHEEGSYTANVLPHKLDVSWDTFPTDEGIVVFDITDPSTPRYGYLWLGGDISRAQYVSRLPLMTVMTAAKYSSGYYNVAELARNNVNGILAELRGFCLIDVAMLRDLWPNSKFRDTKKPSSPPDLQVLSLEDFGSAVIDGYLKAELAELPTTQELRKYRECIAKRFAADPLLLHDKRGWELFTHFVGGVNEVDLTPFVDIRMEQVMAIVKAASARKSLTLHLPSNDSINIEHLRSIVSTTAVCGLHLGRTKQVKLKQMLTELFKDTSLTKLTSPLMFSRVVQITFGPDENLQQAQVRVTEAFPNGIGTRFPLRQIVYLTSVAEAKAKRLESGGLCWKQRTAKSHSVALFVKDALLSIHEMVKLAPAALARLATAQEWQLESQPVAKIVLGIAKMLSIDVRAIFTPESSSSSSSY